MILYPAIDLYNRCVVRLRQGQYNEMTVYSTDPLSTARGFAIKGAQHLHVVDLNGAREGGMPNIEMVDELIEGSTLEVEVGGGIRSRRIVEKYMERNVRRVILGTAAIRNRDLLAWAVERYGDRVAVGADIRDGCLAVKGWTQTTKVRAEDFFRQMEDMGVSRVIVTDISRDGMMTGANRELYRALASEYRMELVASGGVSTLEDVEALTAMGIHGAIIGKALYTGELDLTEAIALAAEAAASAAKACENPASPTPPTAEEGSV